MKALIESAAAAGPVIVRESGVMEQPIAMDTDAQVSATGTPTPYGPESKTGTVAVCPDLMARLEAPAERPKSDADYGQRDGRAGRGQVVESVTGVDREDLERAPKERPWRGMLIVVVVLAVGFVKKDAIWVPFAKSLTIPPNEKGARGFGPASATVTLTATLPELSTVAGVSTRFVVVGENVMLLNEELANKRGFAGE